VATGSNPAGRLLTVLKATLGGDANRKMRDVWAEVFGILPDDTSEILRVASLIIQQISLAQVHVSRVKGANHALFMRPLGELARAFSTINIEEPLSNLKGRLGPNTLSALEYTDEFLRGRSPSGVLTHKTRASLINKVEALARDIRKAELDLEVKRVLVEHIERLRRALLEYELRGPEGVIEALDLNLGFAVRNVALVGAEDAGILKKFGAAIVGFHGTVSAALGLAKLTAGAIKIFKITAGG